LLTMRVRRDDVTLAFFTTMTTLASPQDVTLAQLRIECFHPADADTEAIAARLAADETATARYPASQSAAGGRSVSRASARRSARRGAGGRPSSSRSARQVRRGWVV